MLSDMQKKAVAEAAATHGLEPAALEAVVMVESGGRVSARVGGREEPLIRWEGHYFDRLCRAPVRERARKAGLAAPRAGAIANPRSQSARWALLRRAEVLDRDAALQSVSWGVGQVMGAHWMALGFESVDALVTEARDGLCGQVRLMLRFIAWAGLMPVLKARDWPRFARGYNGPAYRRTRYDIRLERAYDRCRCGATGERPVLRSGDRREAVRLLQERLGATGEDIRADGVFGPLTLAAVLDFQRRHGLEPDGIAGQGTWQALAAAVT